MIQLIQKFRNASFKNQSLLTGLSLALYFLSSRILEKSYTASKFPVPYFVQQTSFDSLKMKEWYAFMIDQNTFGIYFRTQLIDFLFIASVIIAGFCLWTLIARVFKSAPRLFNLANVLAFALPMAGAFDILENIVTLFMMANPHHFHDFLVIPYSSFALLKFACWAIGIVGLGVLLMVYPIIRWLNQKNRIKAIP